MAEDEEIDILSDFDSNIYSSALVSENSDLLNCDYTIHPQWLLDKPSTNPDCWYNASSSSDLGSQLATSENEHTVVENSISDESGWTKNEKTLLERAIEIFGRSCVRISQFIGSKTAAEVKYYIKNFYNEFHALGKKCKNESNTSVLLDTFLNDEEIPTSFEEVVTSSAPKSPGKSKKSLDNTAKSSKYLKQNAPKIKFRFKAMSSIKNNTTKPKVKDKRIKNDPNTSTKVEITTGLGLSIPVCEGEEIIKLSKEADSEISEDIDIDVEDINESIDKQMKPTFSENKVKSVTKSHTNTTTLEPIIKDDETDSEIKHIDFTTFDEEIIKTIQSTQIPKNEIILEKDSASNLEKCFNFEFFETHHKPTKTKSRYLQLRNHIIEKWESEKPKYVNKTSIRYGLKNVGDVNNLSKIHNFLEQIGAINFGCEQTKYERPLLKLLQCELQNNKQKASKELRNQNLKQFINCRQRFKRKFDKNGEGGITVAHGEQGEIINSTVVNEDPKQKQKIMFKKPIIRLIHCRPFSEEVPQKYRIQMNLGALLLMDFHAHSSLTEVMGLIGGTWDSISRTLTITNYEPCKNIGSSLVHCDMCPISQATASDIIHSLQRDVLGWFHSHPTFAPEPSQQDLDTQLVLQRSLGNKNPCLGIILSPFCYRDVLISSPYRCLIVEKKNNFEDQLVPYKFKVTVVCQDFNVEQFLLDIERVLIFQQNNFDTHDNSARSFNFKQPFFQDASITYLDKFISSMKMYLSKCEDIQKGTCDALVQGIFNIFSRL